MQVSVVSIVVPVGRPARAHALADALCAQTSPWPLEIILVSPASSLLANMSSPVRVVAVDRLHPPGKMRNIGVAAAQGEVVMLLDDDCIPPSDWVRLMVQSLLDQPHCAAVGCRVVSMRNSMWDKCADYALFGAYQRRRPALTGLGAGALAVRRDAYLAVGGFDEKLLASEDWDFCLRLNVAGWETSFTPEPVVMHDHGRGSPIAILRASYLSGRRSGITVQLRHLDRMTWLGRLTVRCRHPWLYGIVVLPATLIVTAAQVLPGLRHEVSLLVLWPWIVTARVCYHIGVWTTLCKGCGPMEKPLNEPA